MRPIEFDEQNVVFAKDQPEYLPLPAYKDELQIFHKWKLTWKERLQILLTGVFWINVMNFNRPPQPIRPMLENPFKGNNNESES